MVKPVEFMKNLNSGRKNRKSKGGAGAETPVAAEEVAPETAQTETAEPAEPAESAETAEPTETTAPVELATAEPTPELRVEPVLSARSATQEEVDAAAKAGVAIVQGVEVAPARPAAAQEAAAAPAEAAGPAPLPVDIRRSAADFRTLDSAGWDVMHRRFAEPRPIKAKPSEPPAAAEPAAPVDEPEVERPPSEEAVQTGMVERQSDQHAVLLRAEAVKHRAMEAALGSWTKTRELAAEPRVKAAGVSGAAAAVVMGTGGGAAGLLGGTALGMALGVVPALFTFGLSIPIGGALGGTAGCVTGAFVGGGVGLVGGGVAGYKVYDKKDDIKERANGMWAKAEGSARATRDYVKGQLFRA